MIRALRRGALLLLALVLAGLAAGCGKVGPPHAPGPPDRVTYPKTYPTQ